jgi:hypothetical protein
MVEVFLQVENTSAATKVHDAEGRSEGMQSSGQRIKT